MPVYTLACKQPLAADTRRKVADTITDIHCGVTGAPPEFVNIVFMDNHRIAGGKRVGVIGNVRSGGNRNLELTDRLREQMHQGVAEAAALNQSEVSVMLVGVPASWAMEGGEVLPEPGAEDAWLDRKQGG